MELRVVHYLHKRITDPHRDRKMSWREYQSARNTVLEACRRHGSVGPMDLCPIEDSLSDEEIEDRWQVGAKDAVFFLDDDQLNDERYLYLEITQPDAMTTAWLEDVVAALSALPGWGLCIKHIRDGFLIILPPVLLVTNPAFARCDDVNSVLAAARSSLIV